MTGKNFRISDGGLESIKLMMNNSK